MPQNHQFANIPRDWLDSLQSALQRVNPLVRQLVALSQYPNAANFPDLHLEIQERGAAAPEIAALIRLDNIAARDIAPRKLIIRKHGTNHKQKISSWSSLWEPLSYPLLFPDGTPGWGTQIIQSKLPVYNIFFLHNHLSINRS